VTKHLLWYTQDTTSVEHFRLERLDDGWALSGTVVMQFDAMPMTIRYLVRTDQGWRTDHVDVTIDSPKGRRGLSADVSDGSWRVDGAPRDDLAGALDVDLGWTPSTNTLPLRRLHQDVGDSTTLKVVWIRPVDFEPRLVRQTYERIAESTWRYSSDGFSADLTVDTDLLVTEYGTGLWRAVAAADSAPGWVQPNFASIRRR
jgi:hypothetical protein